MRGGPQIRPVIKLAYDNIVAPAAREGGKFVFPTIGLDEVSFTVAGPLRYETMEEWFTPVKELSE